MLKTSYKMEKLDVVAHNCNPNDMAGIGGRAMVLVQPWGRTRDPVQTRAREC
jgi:hypothetical protein